MSRRNIRITVAYDGTNFWGWQIQKTGRTVQGVLEQALQRIHGHEVRVNAAGRTDSGVHATAQVVNFYSDLDSIPEQQFKDALNSYLPHDVRVLKSINANADFHARFSALSRLYRYYIYLAPVGLPHIRRYCWRVTVKPDIQRVNSLAAAIIGEHDFSSFCATGDTSKSRIKKVFTSCFYWKGLFLVYEIIATSFLRKMVRNIVGTLIEFEKNEQSKEALIELVEKKDRNMAGQTAPARGLFLEKVDYPGNVLARK
jgi:tRNA pseudouridine38-40 synthase